MTQAKRSKITAEDLEEAARLRALWNSRPHRTQAEFGEHYKLGNQANVGHYLAGRSRLNPKAAAAFASELRCEVKEFSPRIAAELESLTSVTNAAKPALVVTSDEHSGRRLREYWALERGVFDTLSEAIRPPQRVERERPTADRYRPDFTILDEAGSVRSIVECYVVPRTPNGHHDVRVDSIAGKLWMYRTAENGKPRDHLQYLIVFFLADEPPRECDRIVGLLERLQLSNLLDGFTVVHVAETDSGALAIHNIPGIATSFQGLMNDIAFTASG